MSSSPNTRSHYRIPYPVTLRPQLSCSLGKFFVFDISEQGLKFEMQGENLFINGTDFKGNVTFHDGEKYNIKGTVLRTEGSFVILELDEGIPLKKIMAEQRFLIKNFPNTLP